MAKGKKKEHDFAVTAFRVVQKAIGHKGGLKGNKARAEN